MIELHINKTDLFSDKIYSIFFNISLLCSFSSEHIFPPKSFKSESLFGGILNKFTL